MDVIVLSVESLKIHVHFLAYPQAGDAQLLADAIGDDASPVLGDKDQMDMKIADNAPPAADDGVIVRFFKNVDNHVFSSLFIDIRTKAKYFYLMRLLTAIRLRLHPTREQESLFLRTAGCCRLLYNLALEQRRTFSRPGRSLRWQTQANELKDLKADLPFLTEVPHHCLQQALVDLDRAYANFFTGRAHHPKPRSRWRQVSFRFPDPAQIKLRTRRDGSIFLPKAKWVRATCHRPIEGTVRSVTVSREGSHWYASILLSQKAGTPAPLPDLDDPVFTAVGVDLGVAQPVVLSDGRILPYPRVSEPERRRMAKLQRQLARQIKGSNRRRNTKERIGRLQARWTRRRRDAREQTSARLVREHHLVAVEDLKVRNMTASAQGTVEEPGTHVRQKAGLNRSLLDVAPGGMRSAIERKAERVGRIAIAVPPRHTSQRCSSCGFHPGDEGAPAGLEHGRVSRDRFSCPACGAEMDADVNAARNIKTLGLKLARERRRAAAAVSGDNTGGYIHPAAGSAVAARGARGVARAVKREQRSGSNGEFARC